MSRFLTGNTPLLLTVSGIRLNELSDFFQEAARAFFLENEACTTAPSATRGLCVLFYPFLNDFHHLAPSESHGGLTSEIALKTNPLDPPVREHFFLLTT